ncbi:MAG TPA: hypothetical protein VMU60_09895, partial [Syntrophobacteria bacterium]|nr:hypothetical protein [Syntrophobacteria bacterium]
VVPWVAIWLGPPAYTLKERALTGEWLRTIVLPTEVTVTTTRYPDAQTAKGSINGMLKPIPTDSVTGSLDITRYGRKDNGRRGVIIPVQNVVVHLEGPDRVSVERALKELPFVSFNPLSPEAVIDRFFDEHLKAFFVGFGVYMVICTFALFRGGPWAARISPPSWIAPVPAEAMRARILGINDLDLPFHVREGKRGYLIAEWRLADARWTTVLEQAGLSIAHSVKMKLDPGRSRVKAIDSSKTVRWSRGVPGLSWSFSFFRGIDFGGFEKGAAYGLLYKDGGWTFDRAYKYSYNLNEMKQPLLAAVVMGGWTYQPVITFIPLLGS